MPWHACIEVGMGKISFILILFFVSSAAAEPGSSAQTLANFIYQQLTLRSGVEVSQSMIDPKESDIHVRTDRRVNTDKVAALEQKQIVSYDGKLIFKKDIIDEVSINGIYVFKNGLVCSIGARMSASQTFKKISNCKVSAHCIVKRTQVISGKNKETTEDLIFEVATNTCSTAISNGRSARDDAYVSDEATAVLN